MRFLIALAAAALPLCAQQPQLPARHETMVVTGVAVPTPLEEADRDVNVIPLPPGQRPLFGSWFDLVQLDPALDLQQRAPGGFLADLSVRGSTFGQTLVLFEGMRLADAQTGHFNLDLPIPLEMISGLEVLKGSGSTLYGSDAIGGVINVRAQTPESSSLRLLAGAGNFGVNQQHAVADFVRAKLSEELAFARDFSSGFAPDRDFRNLNLASLTTLKWKPGPASLLLAYSDRPYGADQFYGPYPSWERIKTWFLAAHQNLGENTEASFAWRRHTDLFVLYRDSPQIYTNRHLLDSWQGDLRRHDNLPLHAVLSYGVEGLSEAVDSTNLGIRSRTRGSAYAFYDLRAFHRFSLSAGLREEVYGSGQVVTSPSVSGAAWLSTRFKLRAAASRAFRLPSYTDLYYSDPANHGNPNLKPESAVSYEGGLDAYVRPNLHAAVTVFQRRDTDVIDYVRANPTAIWQATNFDKLHFTGVEASTVWEPAAGQRVSVSFTALHGADASVQVLSSKYAFNYPQQTGAVEWRGNAGRYLTARSRIGVMNRLGRPAYAVWDASAAWSRGKVRPFLQLTNITSTIYEEIPAVPLPKRGVLGGVEFRIGGAQSDKQ